MARNLVILLCVRSCAGGNYQLELNSVVQIVLLRTGCAIWVH